MLGSSCVYPRNCKQPIKEDYLLQGKLEQTNEPYAIAKIAGIKMCQSYNQQYKTNFLTLIPASIFGENDKLHFIYISNDLNTSVELHVTSELFPQENIIYSLYPNPCYIGDTPIIMLDVKETLTPRIIMFDILGREVLNTSILTLTQGRHEIPLSAIFPTSFSSGIYFTRIDLGDKYLDQKITLIK